MTRRALTGGLVVAGLLVGAAWPAGAEEARAALNTPMILNLLALPVETPEAAFQDSLRIGPVARRSGWEQLPDGSYRYDDGRLSATTVVTKNPCPEAIAHTPLALPGRRAR